MPNIVVNLPVKDLETSKSFYGELGFEVNPEFADERAACMVIDENIFVMLLVEDFFREFINGEIADAAASTEVLNAISAESREAVDELVSTAIAAGGKPWKPVLEEGPMYGGSFQDPDGHVWVVVHMAQA